VQISQLKGKSKPFCRLSSNETKLSVYGLIIKISVITGWQIYDGELLDIFIEQLEKKIEESYGGLNADEIEYAFRQNINDVKDYGKNMNLHIFDEILKPYVARRIEFEKQNVQKPKELPLPVMTNADKLVEIESYLQRTDIRLSTIYLIPSYIYDYCEELQYINHTMQEKIIWHKRAYDLRMTELKNKASSGNIHDIRAYNKLVKEYHTDTLSDADVSYIHNLYKKLSVLDLIIKNQSK